jgi:hypothetical protein
VSLKKTPVWLLDVKRQEGVQAELWNAITDQQLADWEALWKPALAQALQRLHQASVPYKQWPQSRHWDWRGKMAAIQGLLANPSFSVTCSGTTQGLMILETTRRRCRIEVQKGKNLVYVEYVENAPWNRKELLFDPPTYRGVGSILIRAAIETSAAEGFKGRIGLHALPQSNDFYANKCGMTDLGPDASYQNMHYFEMTAEQSEEFIARGAKP